MFILLDLDGVLITTPPWKRPKILSDGFPEFDNQSVMCLNRILEKTKASIVLITSHRNSYSIAMWKEIFSKRGVNFSNIEKNDNFGKTRSVEVLKWIDQNKDKDYIIIDDDSELNNLPSEVKEKWIQPKSLVGLGKEDLQKLNF